MIIIRCDCCAKEAQIETIGAPSWEHFTNPGGKSAAFYPSFVFPKGWIMARAPGNFFGESGTPTACSVECAKLLARGIVRAHVVVEALGDGKTKLTQGPPRLLSGLEVLAGEEVEILPPELPAPREVKTLVDEGPVIDV